MLPTQYDPPVESADPGAALEQALTVARSAEQAAQAMLGTAATHWQARAGMVVRLANGAQLEVLAIAGIEGRMLQGTTRFPVDAVIPIADAIRTMQPVLLQNDAVRRERYPLLAGLLLERDTVN